MWINYKMCFWYIIILVFCIFVNITYMQCNFLHIRYYLTVYIPCNDCVWTPTRARKIKPSLTLVQQLISALECAGDPYRALKLFWIQKKRRVGDAGIAFPAVSFPSKRTSEREAGWSKQEARSSRKLNCRFATCIRAKRTHQGRGLASIAKGETARGERAIVRTTDEEGAAMWKQVAVSCPGNPSRARICADIYEHTPEKLKAIQLATCTTVRARVS